ncbi:2OG-Fe(II) oxygenase family protein [Minwuia sp.]|uniref:2OG-Fe(II) oxygenase family protein n=1 Tax=Minwuia sp. TaxID=2493630 RepID=UPI003A92983E
MADADKIDALLKEASDAMRNGKAKVALRAAKQVLEVQPRSAPALFISGMAEQARGRTDIALNFLQMAAKADPSVPEIQFNLGVFLGLAGRTLESEDVFEGLLKRLPDDVNVLANLGRAQYANRKWLAAAETLKKALKHAPGHVGILEQIGASLQQAGDADGAEKAYRQALVISAENPDVHFNLGTVLSRKNDLEGALSAYKEAVRLNPKHAAAQRNLGHLLSKAGRFEEAIEPHRQASRSFQNDPNITYDLGYALAVSGRTDEALKVLGRALSTHPGSSDFMNMLALTHFRNRDPESALAFAEQALDARPGDNTALAYKAMALNELGRHDEARSIYDIDGLVLAEMAAAPEGFDSIEAFNTAFVSYIEPHPSLSYSPLNRSLKGGQSTRELLDGDDPVATAFRSIIETATAHYRAAHPVDADHPFLARRPEKTEIACWANIIDRGGFQDVHFHPPSWLSGVYYPKLPRIMEDPAREPAGWLEFGRAYYMLDAQNEPPVRLIRPREGLIVLFPAYFGHRTIPFETDEKRISVAFDIMPADRAIGF